MGELPLKYLVHVCNVCSFWISIRDILQKSNTDYVTVHNIWAEGRELPTWLESTLVSKLL